MYTPPIGILVPLPTHIPKGRGVNSTSKRGGNLRVRCTNAEYDSIMAEAAKVDLPLASFCRWVIVHAAEALRQHRKANSTDDVAKVRKHYAKDSIR